MYTDPKIQESIRKVEAARAENVKLSPARMSAEEKENLLKTFHPDYRDNQFTTLHIGANKGEKVPLELCALLGDRKYGRGEAGGIALWSCRIGLFHPESGMWMTFSHAPNGIPQFSDFEDCFSNAVDV